MRLLVKFCKILSLNKPSQISAILNLKTLKKEQDSCKFRGHCLKRIMFMHYCRQSLKKMKCLCNSVVTLWKEWGVHVFPWSFFEQNEVFMYFCGHSLKKIKCSCNSVVTLWREWSVHVLPWSFFEENEENEKFMYFRGHSLKGMTCLRIYSRSRPVFLRVF